MYRSSYDITVERITAAIMALHRISTEIWQAIFQLATVSHCTLPKCMPVYNGIRLACSYFNQCLTRDPDMWTEYEFQLASRYQFTHYPAGEYDTHSYNFIYALWEDRDWQTCIERSGSLSLDVRIYLRGDGRALIRRDCTLVTPIFGLLSRCHSFTYNGNAKIWWQIMHHLDDSKMLKTLVLHRHGAVFDDFRKDQSFLPNLTTFIMYSTFTIRPLIKAHSLRTLELHDMELDLHDAQLAFKWLPGVRDLSVNQVKVGYLLHQGSGRDISDQPFVHFPSLRVFRFVAVGGEISREEQAGLFGDIVASNPTIRAIQIQYSPQLFQIVSGKEVSDLRWLASPMLRVVGISGQHFYQTKGGRPALKKSITNLKNAMATYQTNIRRIRFGHFYLGKIELDELVEASQPVDFECVKCRLGVLT